MMLLIMGKMCYYVDTSVHRGMLHRKHKNVFSCSEVRDNALNHKNVLLIGRF